ncbi:diguanylate cyclase [Leptospira wolffii]|uniref:diguanylate cyclase n=1 Tax=Leptospira wolffii TaxID=409998 RepID=A0A2M9ZCA1_9LEPT|nr:GGDEF domain-containing protein [Leptospira wolffii]EPG65811.1 diguanylate cyclase (GGDEF) domain protein [Leptospira wolffii serovar Khorat str. Khorat-H2]PJZ65982.1 GGDEF domain-containing protein [Leptospira wolffii]TGK59295.1 GGDEF domain-containing protein [Leptospira wolffii]TGK71322.1 GGDEF domain-containing protein [Leptospira wolffii]TGK77889.1 GGDEF domain-containing protein [Leptospira wolffii]
MRNLEQELKSKEEEIQKLREIIGLYERVSKLGEEELLAAELTLNAQETTANLARSELIEMRDRFKGIGQVDTERKNAILEIVNDKQAPLPSLASKFEEMGKKDDYFYSDFFRIVANLDLPESEARSLWKEIYTHAEGLSKQLGRSMNFVVALLDFIYLKNRLIENPKIVDMYSFEEIILNAVIDEGTGIYNRRYFNLVLNKEITRSKRYKRSFCLFLFDLDNFKRINDTKGHEFGDDILKLVAGTLMYAFRTEDISCRVGGEEFAVILPETTKANAKIAIDRFRTYLRNSSKNDFGIEVTVSGGVSEYPSDSEDGSRLYSVSDSRLYEAKAAGKDRISY